VWRRHNSSGVASSAIIISPPKAAANAAVFCVKLQLRSREHLPLRLAVTTSRMHASENGRLRVGQNVPPSLTCLLLSAIPSVECPVLKMTDALDQVKKRKNPAAGGLMELFRAIAIQSRCRAEALSIG
jgi:hypothetical protein